jgi:hypothetical protein
LWDLRRLIVPLTLFIEKPFQNWTRDSTNLIGTVLLYVDFTAPVEAIRARFMEIVQSSKLWDGQVAKLQVTDSKESTIELRARRACVPIRRRRGRTLRPACARTRSGTASAGREQRPLDPPCRHCSLGVRPPMLPPTTQARKRARGRNR